MDDITPEFYEGAKNLKEVREKFIQSFMDGKKVDVDIVDTYKRAQRFLRYLKGVKNLAGKKPLYISHGLFPRFLEIAIKEIIRIG